jgi:aminopeptidase N
VKSLAQKPPSKGKGQEGKGDEGEEKGSGDANDAVALTQVDARYRASMISDTVYDVSIALPKGDAFFGHVKVQFSAKEAPSKDKPIFLDFLGKKIKNVRINGEQISALDNTEYIKTSRIPLPSDKLKKGQNVVEMDFLSQYRNDGQGLHSYIDQVDQKQYLYTDFEPSYAHYLFPNFDQPDIRAKWALKTIIPKDWVVVANELPNKDNQSASLT